MISIYDIKSWSDVATFLIWTLAVCAIAKALFGSLVAAELQYRFSLRDAPRRQQMNRLNWEINNRTRWSEDAARNAPHAAKTPLTVDELDGKRRELEQLTRVSFGVRALRYFMGCFACQTFWASAVAFAVSHGVTHPAGWLFSAAAYSGAAVILAALNSRVPTPHTAAAPACKRCGGER